jgi:predicted Zn-dependent protease
MIEETKKGVYFRVTFDHPNLATGELSALMMESYLVERGQMGPSLRQSTLGVGLVDLLSRIDMLGKESRDMFGVRTPHLRVSRARIAGSA